MLRPRATLRYKAATTVSKGSACTNVPIICPACPSTPPAVSWRYYAHNHFLLKHPARVTSLADIWLLSDTEYEAMAMVWEAILKQRKKPAAAISKGSSKKAGDLGGS